MICFFSFEEFRDFYIQLLDTEEGLTLLRRYTKYRFKYLLRRVWWDTEVTKETQKSNKKAARRLLNRVIFGEQAERNEDKLMIMSDGRVRKQRPLSPTYFTRNRLRNPSSPLTLAILDGRHDRLHDSGFLEDEANYHHGTAELQIQDGRKRVKEGKLKPVPSGERLGALLVQGNDPMRVMEELQAIHRHNDSLLQRQDEEYMTTTFDHEQGQLQPLGDQSRDHQPAERGGHITHGHLGPEEGVGQGLGLGGSLVTFDLPEEEGKVLSKAESMYATYLSTQYKPSACNTTTHH